MHTEDHEHETSSLSLRARRKKPSVTLSCCFNGGGHRRADSFDVSSSSSLTSPSPRRISPSSWIRSKATDPPHPHHHHIKIKGKYKSLVSRMSRHRRHSSAEFSYDPLSYALNFEDNDHDSTEVEEEFPVRSFAARLPSSSPRSSAAGGRMNERRAAAVAEVRKGLLQQEEEEETTTTRTARGSAEDVVEVGELMRRSPEIPPTPAAAATSRRNNDTRRTSLHEDVPVSPAYRLTPPIVG